MDKDARMDESTFVFLFCSGVVCYLTGIVLYLFRVNADWLIDLSYFLLVGSPFFANMVVQGEDLERKKKAREQWIREGNEKAPR
jgi:predicted membrane channel-forming protein YqfA (hemolysin III family)